MILPTFLRAARFPRLCVPVALFEQRAPAGFPSPAEGYAHRTIDLNEWLISNPPSTFLFQVEGRSMIGAEIHDGDWLICDRAAEARDRDIVLAVLDAQFTVKRFRRAGGRVWLQPENAEFCDIEISEERDFAVWAVVQSSIRVFNRHGHRHPPTA